MKARNSEGREGLEGGEEESEMEGFWREGEQEVELEEKRKKVRRLEETRRRKRERWWWGERESIGI